MIDVYKKRLKKCSKLMESAGLEYTFLTQSMMGMLTHPHAKPEAVAPKDCTHIMSELRLIKDDGEIKRIHASAKVADEFWRSYVSSGQRTNIAHGLPTQRKLDPGDLVMIDLHPIVNGYSADMCRTLCAGKPAKDKQDMYDLYLKAQQTTIAKVKAGAGVAELEETLHGILKDAGHEEHIFGPPIHGVGIEFEEAPLPPGHAFFHGEKEPSPLEANTVISVGNCGLYPGKFGVRVEDTVVVEEKAPRVLTGYPRRL